MAMPTTVFAVLLATCAFTLVASIRLDPVSAAQLRNLKFSPHSYDYANGYGGHESKPEPGYGHGYFRPAVQRGYPFPRNDFFGYAPKSYYPVPTYGDDYGKTPPHAHTAYLPSKQGYPSFGHYNEGPFYKPKPRYPSYGLDNKAEFSSFGKHGMYGEGDIAQKFFGDSKSTAYGTEQKAGGLGGSKVKGKFQGDLTTSLDASTSDPYGRRNDVWTKALNKVDTEGVAKTNYLNDLFSKTTKHGSETKAKAANTLSGYGKLSATAGISGGTNSIDGNNKHGGT